MLSGSRAGIYASQAEQERERGWETKRQREKVRMGERDERERLGERERRDQEREIRRERGEREMRRGLIAER